MFSLVVLAHLITYFRLKKGKEDRVRVKEKFGIPSDFALQKFEQYQQFCSKNNIQVKTIWLHAVSVGESLSVLDFVNKLNDKNYFIIFTTTTVTSAEMIKNKLPQNAVHQYRTHQTKKYLTRFLKTWKPSMVFFVENEIFPTTINMLYSNKIPLYLLNARLSENSFKMWKIAKFYIKNLLKKYTYIFPLSREEENKFLILSNNDAKTKCFGNLKFDVAIVNKQTIDDSFNKNDIPQDIAKCRLIQQAFKDKKIIVFGSIHDTEFFHLLWQYEMILKKLNCVGIFVPRYIDQCKLLETQAVKAGFKPTYWNDFCGSINENFIIVNKMNVVQNLYKICDIAVIGGSFAEKIGGHNPLESIVFNKPTFIGKYCHKCQNLINELLDNNVIFQTSNLSKEILDFLQQSGNKQVLENNVCAFFIKHTNVANKIIAELNL